MPVASIALRLASLAHTIILTSGLNSHKGPPTGLVLAKCNELDQQASPARGKNKVQLAQILLSAFAHAAVGQKGVSILEP